MKRILFFSVTLFALALNCFGNHWCYAKEVSESDIKKIEAEAQQKSLESKKLQAQTILNFPKLIRQLLRWRKKFSQMKKNYLI